MSGMWSILSWRDIVWKHGLSPCNSLPNSWGIISLSLNYFLIIEWGAATNSLLRWFPFKARLIEEPKPRSTGFGLISYNFMSLYHSCLSILSLIVVHGGLADRVEGTNDLTRYQYLLYKEMNSSLGAWFYWPDFHYLLWEPQYPSRLTSARGWFPTESAVCCK